MNNIAQWEGADRALHALLYVLQNDPYALPRIVLVQRVRKLAHCSRNEFDAALNIAMKDKGYVQAIARPDTRTPNDKSWFFMITDVGNDVKLWRPKFSSLLMEHAPR